MITRAQRPDGEQVVIVGGSLVLSQTEARQLGMKLIQSAAKPNPYVAGSDYLAAKEGISVYRASQILESRA